MITNGTDVQQTSESDVDNAASEPEPTELKTDEPSDAGDAVAPEGVKSTRQRMSISFTVRGLAVGAVILAVVAVVAVGLPTYSRTTRLIGTLTNLLRC